MQDTFVGKGIVFFMALTSVVPSYTSQPDSADYISNSIDFSSYSTIQPQSSGINMSNTSQFNILGSPEVQSNIIFPPGSPHPGAFYPTIGNQNAYFTIPNGLQSADNIRIVPPQAMHHTLYNVYQSSSTPTSVVGEINATYLRNPVCSGLSTQPASVHSATAETHSELPSHKPDSDTVEIEMNAVGCFEETAISVNNINNNNSNTMGNSQTEGELACQLINILIIRLLMSGKVRANDT